MVPEEWKSSGGGRVPGEWKSSRGLEKFQGVEKFQRKGILPEEGVEEFQWGGIIPLGKNILIRGCQ
jgi:hypothetical protein